MVISRVISRVTILISHIRGLITLLITTPEPPRGVQVEPGCHDSCGSPKGFKALGL